MQADAKALNYGCVLYERASNRSRDSEVEVDLYFAPNTCNNSLKNSENDYDMFFGRIRNACTINKHVFRSHQRSQLDSFSELNGIACIHFLTRIGIVKHNFSAWMQRKEWEREQERGSKFTIPIIMYALAIGYDDGHHIRVWAEEWRSRFEIYAEPMRGCARIKITYWQQQQ